MSRLCPFATGLFLLAQIAALPSAALDPAQAAGGYGVRTWASREGLPQSGVFAISQSPDGYLWLATRSALLRFDGVRFVPALEGASLRVLAGRSGEMWSVSGTHELFHWDGRRGSAWERESRIPWSVEALFEDREGSLWIGGAAGMARLKHGKDERAETFPALAGRGVLAFAEEPGGALWIGTSVGLFRRQAGTLASVAGAPGDRITALAMDRKGGLWVGTPAGLGRLQGGRWTAFSVRDGLPDNLVTALLSDRDGTLWVGTQGGLARFSAGRFEAPAADPAAAGEAVLSLREDAEGSVWIGTETGLVRLSDTAFTSFRPPGATNLVWSIAEDSDGTLWLGTDANGLLRWRDGQVTAFTTAEGLPANKVRPILRDRRGDLWVGTLRGLARLRGETIETWTAARGLPDDYVLALLEDGDGTLWIGTYRGVARMRDGRAEPLPADSGLPAETVYMLRRDRQGRLLMGTRKGLYRELETPGRFEAVPGGPVKNIFCALEDPDGTLWLGSAGAGLLRLRQGRWTAFRQSDGMPDDSSFHLFEDGQGRFWGSSDRGIFRVRRADLEAFAAGRLKRIPAALFGADDGLQVSDIAGGNQPGALASRDGRFWFPTSRGVIILDPRRSRETLPPPRIVIEKVLSQGKEIPWLPGAPLVLPRGQRDLEVRSTALSFRAPEQLRLKYRLEGFDKEWKEAGLERSAVYTNLPPGHYIFHVIGGNHEGIWNETGARLNLEIPPFFWERAWFIPACLVLLLAAVRLRLQAMHRHKLELARVVDERTRDLREEKARAEAASRAKSEFLANMSHEIRTPLNAVLGLTGLVLRSPLAAEQREHLELARQSGEALLAVINDILDVSKIEAGELEIEISPFDLRSCVEGAVSLVAQKAAAKGIPVYSHFAAECPAAVESDAGRLRQILVNLLDNAVKFTARGDIHLEVEAEAPRDGWLELRFAVRDSGIGIPAAALDRLFKPFVQVDSSTSRLYGGTGLGLVIARRLAERLGGRLWVESELGRGSAFFFTIRCRPAEPVAVPAAGPEMVEIERLAERLPWRILVAEDNAVNQKVVELMLARMGYRADMAENGFAVLDALRRQSYDVILMDVQMPGMDGLEAARRLRAELPAERQPRIIAVTANVLAELREACLAAGMDDFVVKPIRFADLHAALLRVAGPVLAATATASEPGPDAPPLNPALLDDLIRLQEIAGRPLVAEIVDRFLLESPQRLERMRNAVERADAKDLAFLAHSLKGSSSQIGAVRVQALSRELESADLESASALLAALEMELARVAPLLEERKQGALSSPPR